MNARDAKVVELICSSCGFRSCGEGQSMCKDAVKKAAGVCTREEFERRHVETKRQRQAAAA